MLLAILFQGLKAGKFGLRVLPRKLFVSIEFLISFFREKALSPCRKITGEAIQSPHTYYTVSSAVLTHLQIRRPTPIQSNSDGPLRLSQGERAEMQTFRRAAFTRHRQEHTQSRDSARADRRD